MYYILILIFTILILPTSICFGATINATSGSRTHVSDAIALADYGDTVVVPACADGDCVWDSGIEVTKNIIIQGAGIDVTYLVRNFAGADAFFKFNPDATAKTNINTLSSSGTFEVSGFTFKASSRVSYTYGVWITSNTTPVIRRIKIHDNKFINLHRAMMSYGYVNSVFYSNQLIDTNADYPDGPGYAGFDNMRTLLGSADGIYIEDNTFTFNGVDAGVTGGGNDGHSGFVVRYNTVIGTLTAGSTYLENHGNSLSSVYGSQRTEVYGNSMTATGLAVPTKIRGGKNIYMYNIFTPAAGYRTNGLIVWEEYSDLATSDTYPTGRCAENQGVSRQTCTDSCICQKIHDSYFLNNRDAVTGTINNASLGTDNDCGISKMDCENRTTGVANDPLELIENTEYFNHQTSFDGTVGVGCGTLASRPATCTTGVGYWATTQSCSDLTGMVGASPSTPISGTLYICGATGWADGSTYTPYTYPHPLRGVTPSGSMTIGTGTSHTIGTGGGVITLGN